MNQDSKTKFDEHLKQQLEDLETKHRAEIEKLKRQMKDELTRARLKEQQRLQEMMDTNSKETSRIHADYEREVKGLQDKVSELNTLSEHLLQQLREEQDKVKVERRKVEEMKKESIKLIPQMEKLKTELESSNAELIKSKAEVEKWKTESDKWQRMYVQSRDEIRISATRSSLDSPPRADVREIYGF